MTKEESGTKIDRLKEDVPIPRQNYYCVSFLSPEGIRNCTLRALKIRGVYDTKEEAKERCLELQTTDPNFHVFVGEVGKWCPWDPDPNSMSSKDQEYQQKELNDLMKGYEENLTRAKKMQDQRKGDMIKNAAYESKTRKEEMQIKLKKKLERRNMEKRMNDQAVSQMSNMLPKSKSNKLGELEKKEKQLESQSEQTKKERERLHKNETTVANQKANVSDIGNKLDKIKALYNKLQSKNTDTSSSTTGAPTESQPSSV